MSKLPKSLIVKEKDPNHFFGTYKGCEINIDRAKGEEFYIQVRHTDGGYLYDGWFPDSTQAEGIGIDDAIEEALDGAQLLPAHPNTKENI